MVPVALHGASRSTASNGGASKSERVGDHDLGVKAQAIEIGGKQLEPLGRAIDRREIGPRRSQFCGFSARRGAEVDDPHAGSRPKEPGRQRRRGVLHPPFAVRVAFEFRDRRMGVEAHRAGRQNHSAELLGPTAASLLTLRSSVGSERCAKAMARATLSP